MIRRSMREPLDPEDCMDADLRKKVFREIGGDLTRSMREGFVTDAPGKVAALMEKAFRMGAELALRSDFSLTHRNTVREITDMDVPSAPRNALISMRIHLGIDPFSGRARRNLAGVKSCQLGLIMQPKIPGYPSTLSKDDWMVPSGYGNEHKTYSNKSILPLIKMGLLADARELGNGWKATYVTEWGFELLLSGKTAGPDNRSAGTSSTYARYYELVHEGEGPIAEAAYALGILSREKTPGPSR